MSDAGSTAFDVWGCRGSRGAWGSRIGNHTSCYSLRVGEDLFVFDAGRGLAPLSRSLREGGKLHGVRRVCVLVTHAHLDHWEGLKDADWMWTRNNGVELTLCGPREALETIHRGHEPPSFVPLELLAKGTLASMTEIELVAGSRTTMGAVTIETAAMHHYSGRRESPRHLETLGYLVSCADGPSVAYLSDHEPIPSTQAIEDSLVGRSQLAVIDASYPEIKDQKYGHGSQEYVAGVARRHPNTIVLAAHHGPTAADDEIEAVHQRHGAGVPNFAIAIEGRRFVWDTAARCFH